MKDYQKVSLFYDRDFDSRADKGIGVFFDPERSWYRRFLPSGKNGDRLLDIGCGPGHLLAVAASLDLRCYGVDISLYLARQARNFPFGKHLAVCNVENGLPFVRHSFDMVTCIGVLQYVKSPEVVMHEIVRVAKPGARIVLHVPNERAWLRLLGWESDSAKGSIFVKNHSLAGWSALLSENGLAAVSVEADNSGILLARSSSPMRRWIKRFLGPLARRMPLNYAESFTFTCRLK